MLGSGAASSDGEVPTQSRRWGGFHGKLLTTSSSVRLNVLLGRKGTISCESSEDAPVRTVVWAHIVPDRVMSYDLLLGRDSWDHFPVRKYRDTNEEETVVTFTAQDDGSAAGDHRFKKWVDQAIGMIESPADCKVVVRHADKSCMLSEGFTWVRVELRNCDGSAADPGSYYVREAIVDAGLSEIPQDSTSPQQATLTEGRRTNDTTPIVMKTEWDKDPPQPPQIVMSQLDPQQQKSFSRLWSCYESLERVIGINHEY